MSPLIMIGSCLVVLILAGMVAAIMLGNQKEQQKRTLAVIKGQFNAEAGAGKNQRTEQDKRRAEIARKLKEGNGPKKKGNLKLLIEQAGLSISIKQYWLFSFISAAVCPVIAFLCGLPAMALPGAALVGLFLPPRIFLGRRIKKRQKKFIEEFADTLEAMTRLIKAGMPISEAVAMAAREFGGPIGEEMSRVYDAQRIGIPLAEAALDMARRMPLTEVQMFATGLSIQAQTGASLSEVLMNLAGVIRARYRLKRKVQALSSEAKASAMIIGSLPFLVGGGLFFINPGYMNIMFETLPGIICLCFGAFWMLSGIAIMKVMINFKI